MQETIQIFILDKYFRTNKVEQGEKFFEIILKRCSGDEKSSTRDERANNLREDGIDVFDSMGFVNNDIFERKFLQSSRFDQAHFIRGNTNMEILSNEPGSNNFRTFVFSASQHGKAEIRSPLLEFTVPVLKCRLGYNNQVRPRDISVMFEISQE